MNNWPEDIFEFAFIPNVPQRLDELASLVEVEDWGYKRAQSGQQKPILLNYLKYTYKRVVEEGKVEISDSGRLAVFNTGLVTQNQEPVYALFERNNNPDRQPWKIADWCRRGQSDLVGFSHLPEMANYFDNPSSLVFDVRKELRINIEHIIAENKERFPDPYNAMENYMLQTFLKGAIDNAKERIRRNYKTAIPQYYKGRVQLLLPLCITNAGQADLALVAEDHGVFYRASTCLTLDMAYNNARQLARPDKDWLQP